MLWWRLFDVLGPVGLGLLALRDGRKTSLLQRRGHARYPCLATAVGRCHTPPKPVDCL